MFLTQCLNGKSPALLYCRQSLLMRFQATFQPNLYRVLNQAEREYLIHLQVRQRLTPQ